MHKTLLKLTIAVLTILMMTGCIDLIPNNGLKSKPIAQSFASMTAQEATIATAIAVQVASEPIIRYKTVVFAANAVGLSYPELSSAGFEFTAAKLYASTAAGESKPGLIIGEVELTDPFDRKVAFLYRAEYSVKMEQTYISKLEMEPNYTNSPRVDVTAVKTADLPHRQMSFTDMVIFLADKGVAANKINANNASKYTIIALAKDWAAPTAKLTLAISAKKTGSSGYSKGSKSNRLEGHWPIATISGSYDTTKPLYARVSFKAKSGFSTTKTLGTYKLSAND